MRYLNDNTDPNQLNWQRVIQALTDPSKALNFPVKYPAIELDQSSKNALYYTASIIALGLIVSAAIKANQ